MFSGFIDSFILGVLKLESDRCEYLRESPEEQRNEW